MSDADVQQLQQANAQRSAVQRATFEALMAKPRRTTEVQAVLKEGADPVSFKFVALPGADYDAIMAAHPATEEQRRENPTANMNGKTFPQALLAEVVVEPKMSVEEWNKIFANPAWNRGELMSLFWQAEQLCSRSLDLTPFVSG